MNNKHQEQIAEKVAEFANQHPKRLAEILTFFEKALQDTIDTVVAEERERVLEALTTTKDTTQMLQGWERYWIEVKPNRFVENCIECENTVRILKALDNTPPNKV